MGQNVTNFMRIERNHPTAPLPDIERPGKPSPPAAGPPLANFEESHRLDQVLSDTPEVRPDQVARAKALVADPTFPSKEQLGKIAGLLAANWQRED
jgi:hypothetical protein